MAAIRLPVIAWSLAIAGATACFAIGDIDRFHAAPDPDAGPANNGLRPNEDVRVTATAMDVHIGQYVEFRIVDDRNFIVSRAIVDRTAMTTNKIDLFIPQSVPNGDGHPPFRLDFFADVNDSRTTDAAFDGTKGANADHSWRVPLDDSSVGPGVPHREGVYNVSFVHSVTTIKNIDELDGLPDAARDTSLAARVTLVGASKHRGKPVEIRIAQPPPSNHVVGLYRLILPSEADSTTVEIPGCVVAAFEYSVSVFVDELTNGKYDSPATAPGDFVFVQKVKPDTSGLNTSIDLSKDENGKNDVGWPL